VWQWLSLFKQTHFLDQALVSLRLRGAPSSRGAIIGSPAGEVDPAALLAAVRAQAATMRDPGGFVYQFRTTSWSSHAYVAFKDVTPSPEELARNGVAAARFRRAATSPRAFLAAWLLSVPMTARFEAMTDSGPVLRMMRFDPVVTQDFRAWHVVHSKGAATQAATLLASGDLRHGLVAPDIDVTEGGVVMSFSTRTCWDLRGLSHVVIGTLFHCRVVDLASGSPRVYEVRVSVGGGSVTGGLPDAVMASRLWSEQTATIERMLARPRLHDFLDELTSLPDAERRILALNAARARFARHPPWLVALSLAALPYRMIQRHLPSARRGERIAGRYVVKQPGRSRGQ